MKLKNKKGFTLIELLAVIVVLAIIALIATPIVMNTIKKSQKGVAERSADNYREAVETIVATERLNGNILEGTYIINDKGNLEGNGLKEPLTIEMNGNKPTGGTIIIKNGQVTTESTMTVGSYEVKYNQEKNKYEASNKGNTSVTYKNGQEVYFNVDNGTKCTSSDYMEANSNTGYNGINPSSEQTSCLKFYAFNDGGGDTVNLILDHNTTASVAWNDTYTDDDDNIINAKGPKEVLEQLKSDTDEWKGTITPSNYTMDQTEQESNANYTIKYKDEGYKARLITAQEVATITGYIGWNEKNADSMYYFDSKTDTVSNTCQKKNTSGCSYGWLYDRTHESCKESGCLNNSDISTYGYWTASSFASASSYAWDVIYGGNLNYASADDSIYDGVRPVIEVLRSKLS